MINAAKFINKYLASDKALQILDIGSYNVNGTLRPLFEKGYRVCRTCGNQNVSDKNVSLCCGRPMEEDFGMGCTKPVSEMVRNRGEQWTYKGLDIGEQPNPSKNVDIAILNPYSYPLEDNSVDVIVSSSCLEHDPMFWLSIKEMSRILREGGYIYINVPSQGATHRYPLDCWRFRDDAWSFIPLWCPELTICETYIDQDVKQHSGWYDNVGIFQKNRKRTK